MTETDSSEDGPTDDNGAEPSAAERNADEGNSDERADDERPDTDSRTLGAGVVTIATERALESDAAGKAIVTALKKDNHEVVTREHIGTDHDRVQSTVSRMIDRDDVDIVVTAGSTSVEPSDITIEAVSPLLDKDMTTFDDLFTMLAYEAVGTSVIAARTIAGVTEGTPVFCLPGNEDAARLAIEEIILPEADFLVDIAREDRDPGKWGVDESEPDDAVSETADDADLEDGRTDAETESSDGGA